MNDIYILMNEIKDKLHKVENLLTTKVSCYESKDCLTWQIVIPSDLGIEDKNEILNND